MAFEKYHRHVLPRGNIDRRLESSSLFLHLGESLPRDVHGFVSIPVPSKDEPPQKGTGGKGEHRRSVQAEDRREGGERL